MNLLFFSHFVWEFPVHQQPDSHVHAELAPTHWLRYWCQFLNLITDVCNLTRAVMSSILPTIDNSAISCIALVGPVSHALCISGCAPFLTCTASTVLLLSTPPIV